MGDVGVRRGIEIASIFCTFFVIADPFPRRRHRHRHRCRTKAGITPRLFRRSKPDTGLNLGGGGFLNCNHLVLY